MLLVTPPFLVLTPTILPPLPTDDNLLLQPPPIPFDLTGWGTVAMDWRNGWWRSKTDIWATPTDCDLFNVPRIDNLKYMHTLTPSFIEEY